MVDDLVAGYRAWARPAQDRQDDLEGLRQAVRDCRRVWRWHWERFWVLRWENALRRPSWRVDEEAQAWQRMRAEVRRYARLRNRLATASTEQECG